MNNSELSGLSTLLIDDDPDSIAILKHVLRQRFPELTIEGRTQPDTSGSFDIYFVDNDFDGQALAGDLAESIRSCQPHALIIAFSARLDTTALKRLISAGCDWACDKSEPEEVLQMLNVVNAYFEIRDSLRREKPHLNGVVPTMRAIADLIRQWNQRLDRSRSFSGS